MASNKTFDYNNPDPKKALGTKKLQMYHTIPPAVRAEIAKAYTLLTGELKYPAFNWAMSGAKVESSTYINARHRHETLYDAGEDYSRDMRVHHLAAIAASCCVELDAIFRGTWADDRVKYSKDVLDWMNETLESKPREGNKDE